MKRFISVAAMATCLLLGFNVVAQPKIFRVGYSGPHINGVDFNDLQSAHDAAGAGTIIYLYPSGSTNTWTATYSKKLTTISFGYFVDTASLGTGANAGLQHIVGATSTSITLTTAAKGCVFEGIDGFELKNEYKSVDSIAIKRCNVALHLKGYPNGSAVVSNWQVIQSVITNINASYTITDSYAAFFQNLLVSNCILNNVTGIGNSTLQTGFFINNIFTDNWNDPSFIFKNNVFLYEGNFTVLSSSTYSYNVFVGNPSGLNGFNNKINQNKDSIFVGYSNQKTFSNDGRWRLKQNSVAANAGENGIDCGVYAQGSGYPYKPSGIPDVPSFYRLDAPSSTTENTPTYKITFSVRSNN